MARMFKRNSLIKSLIIIFALYILTSCSNPGYGTLIYLSEDTEVTENDIVIITSIPQQLSHEVVMVKEEPTFKVESYKINLDEKKFDVFDHKYIIFVVEYHYDKQTTSGRKNLNKVEVRIGNVWEGRTPILKEEIDKLTDQTINLLSKRFDNSAIKTKRRYTMPM
jgi:hypothetical protein